MKLIETIEELESIYGKPSPRSLTKVVRTITPLYKTWIEASRFVVLTTVGPEGTDASPRGDDGPVARIEDDKTLLLPDWRGNNRVDSLRNIVRDGRVSLMFMVPGIDDVVRVNGQGVLSDDTAVIAKFERDGKRPRTVIVVTVDEAYFQCAKALMRSNLWAGVERPKGIPTAGEFVKAREADFDAEAYDANYEDYARPIMW